MAPALKASAAPAELEELRSVLRNFLVKKSPVTRVLELMESTDGYDRAVWTQMSEQLALPALAIPDRLGGQGFSFRELAVVLEELGRVAYMGPLFATSVLATQALLLSGDEQACAEFLPEIADGSRTATVAVFEPGRGWATDAVLSAAERDGDGWRLTGVKDSVLDGATADLILVNARCEGESGLFAIDRASPGVSTKPIEVLDLTRPLATVRFDDSVATRVGRDDVTDEVLEYALAGLACEQAAAAEACLDMTVQYVSERIQFGRPIGSYQAVRHRCADMFVLAETARSTARHAVRSIADSDPEAPLAVGVAKSFCSDAFLRIAQDTVQLHGGIGFTWEHPAHVFFKRAKASALMFGNPAAHRARIAPALLKGARV